MQKLNEEKIIHLLNMERQKANKFRQEVKGGYDKGYAEGYYEAISDMIQRILRLQSMGDIEV